VYAKNYGIQICGFRYFNVFGPRQDPDGPYAAVIPLFIKSALENRQPIINGDPNISRDFTYVSNAVKANLAGIFLFGDHVHEVFNIACGKATSLLKIWELISESELECQKPLIGPPRKGDIKFSLADIQKATSLLKYIDLVQLEDGLRKTKKFYKYNFTS
jgi:UDP-N-acetylglucosamine 4-epimerase